MMRADLMDGQEYAFREKRTVGSPLHRIKLLKHIRGRKWQARWIRPNAGLVDYVSAEQILVPWNEQAAYLKEERDRVLMWQHNLKHGFEASSPITYAVYTVIENSGENIGVGDSDIAATPERLERLKARAQLDHLQLCDIKPSYKDRMGRLHLPFETALELARAFCAAEPSAVIAVVEAEERQASYMPSVLYFDAPWARASHATPQFHESEVGFCPPVVRTERGSCCEGKSHCWFGKTRLRCGVCPAESWA